MAWVWDRPKDSGKWHIFRTLGLRSLCGKWLSSDPDSDHVEGDGLIVAGKNDCKKCVRELNAIRLMSKPWLQPKPKNNVR